MMPIYLPDLYQALAGCDVIGGKCDGAVVAAGGKVVQTDNRSKRTRWNNTTAAADVWRMERRAKSQQRIVREATNELRSAKQGLLSIKTALASGRVARDAGGRSIMRLDYLRSWVEEHMQSICAIATSGPLMRFRFCAAVMSGAGGLADSPTRFVTPAMWVSVDIDTGQVVEARSDGCRTGAFHPHAREDSGDPCIGRAVPTPGASEISIDAIKAVLTGIEKWRLCYGDDYHHRPRDVAMRVWDVVEHRSVGLAPIQGTTGRVYENLNTLLEAEPWDGRVSRRWCGSCDTTYERCGCCGECGAVDGECRCDSCPVCGHAGCDCCTYCDNVEATWNYRGSGNEHQVCNDCGYCRLCNRTDVTDGLSGAGRVLWFLTETDVGRIETLARIGHERGRTRPGDYSEGCDCVSCRAHTMYLRSQRT